MFAFIRNEKLSCKVAVPFCISRQQCMKSSSCSTSLAALGIIFLFVCLFVFNSGIAWFYFALPYWLWCWTSVHMFICHLYCFFGELFKLSACFFIWLVIIYLKVMLHHSQLVQKSYSDIFPIPSSHLMCYFCQISVLLISCIPKYIIFYFWFR